MLGALPISAISILVEEETKERVSSSKSRIQRHRRFKESICILRDILQQAGLKV